MALTTLIPANVTVVSCYPFGGPSGKKRKRMTVLILDAADTSGGVTVGANAGDIPVSIFPGFSFIEECSDIAAFVDATDVVARVYQASPDPLGTSIITTTSSATSGAATDMVLAAGAGSTQEAALLTITGY
jgi:hypothetical protein